KNFIANSLSPAEIESIEINEKENIAQVKVADDQLSLAIGRSGQNVRLAAKLTGWKIDIVSAATGDKISADSKKEKPAAEESTSANKPEEKVEKKSDKKKESKK